MKNLTTLALALGLVFSGVANANYKADNGISRIEVFNNRVTVRFDSILPSSCSYWGSSARFDARTPGGQTMLSTLLAAKVNNRRVDVWYDPKGVTGDCNNNIDGLAELTGVGIN